MTSYFGLADVFVNRDYVVKGIDPFKLEFVQHVGDSSERETGPYEIYKHSDGVKFIISSFI